IAAAGRLQAPLALHGLITQNLHARIGDRVAVLVEDAARDGGAFRQREVRALHHLAIGNFDWRTRFKRSLLSVSKRHVARLRRGQTPTACWKILEFETSLGVGADEPVSAQLAGLG